MRIRLSRTISGAALTIVLAAVSTFGSQRHQALNGTWTLVPTKSDFAGQAVFQTGTVTIDDRQGNITVARHFTYDGAAETIFYSFSTDGRENATIETGKDFKSKAKWEGDVLKVTTTRGGSHYPRTLQSCCGRHIAAQGRSAGAQADYPCIDAEVDVTDEALD